MKVKIAALGGGTNSAAMLIGLRDEGIIPDLILFADTGAEMPHTYDFVYNHLDPWLEKNGIPNVTTVSCERDGKQYTILDDCKRRKTLPAAAFGFKTCSLRFKQEVQDKYCNSHDGCKAVWATGNKIDKYIGYDAGEETRITNAAKYDRLDKKYNRVYWLYEHGWDREECVSRIKKEGLPLPGKSSCFICPNMKRKEIREMRQQYPDLFQQAIDIEAMAQDILMEASSVNGLGRSWRWADLDKDQLVWCGAFEESSMPCGCYDG